MNCNTLRVLILAELILASPILILNFFAFLGEEIKSFLRKK